MDYIAYRSIPVAAGVFVASLGATSAHASIIGVEGLDTVVPANTVGSLNINNEGFASFYNSFGSAGSDYYGNPYYNKSVNLSSSAVSLSIGSGPVAAGTLISSVSGNSALMDTQHANFYTAQVGTGNCGKNCTYPIYGNLAYYTGFSNTGSSLYVPISVTKSGHTDFGFINLSISNPGTNNPYAVAINGYELQTNGSGIRAGAPLSAVPLPPALSLFAAGVTGLALWGRSRNRKQIAAA